MSATAKKSFVWLWMAALLTATVGISVHEIYCYCLGRTTSFALFAPAADDGDCAVKPAAAPCCKKDRLPPCCAKAADDAKDHSCKKKSTQVFQLKTEFLVDKPFEKALDFPLWLEELPFFARPVRSALCDASGLFNKAPPPLPVSGREICLRHELFRC